MIRTSCAVLHEFCCCCNSYIKGLLGGPTPTEYEALKQEKEDLKQQLALNRKQLEDVQAKVQTQGLYTPLITEMLSSVPRVSTFISVETVDKRRGPLVIQAHQALRQPAEYCTAYINNRDKSPGGLHQYSGDLTEWLMICTARPANCLLEAALAYHQKTLMIHTIVYPSYRPAYEISSCTPDNAVTSFAM